MQTIPYKRASIALASTLCCILSLGLLQAQSLTLLMEEKKEVGLEHRSLSAEIEANYKSWRKNITATVFWVGENACPANPVHNHSSSWDKNWKKSYGGVDHPYKRKGFHPVGFTPKMNPFYIALPYNDIARKGYGHRKEASRVIWWFTQDYKGRAKSVCKGKWVAVKFGDKICYAQWEDCGPFFTDDWEYVFRGKVPKQNRNQNAGIDISPAVRDYLGVKSGEQVSWKFVEELEIVQGPWKKWVPDQKMLVNGE
mgnify:CR=1 FL=1